MFVGAMLAAAFAGCSLPPSRAELDRLEAKLQAQEQRQSVPPNRFELHELRNGPVITTGLLDKQTGRVWMLAAQKGGGNSVGGFEPLQISTFTPQSGQYFGPYVPPTAPTPEIELPQGWHAKELAATITPDKEPKQ
jgi:hypothetical protein